MSHIIFPKTNTCCSSSPQLVQENILTPPPPEGICHMPPLPPSSSVLSFRMFQESSSPHTYPPLKLINKKKNSPYPHPRRDVPHAPPPLPLWIFYNSSSTQTYPLMLSWQLLTTPKLKCLTHFLSCKLNMFVQRKDFCTCRKNLSYQKFFCLLGIIRARKQRKLWIKIDSTNNRCNHTLDFLYIVVQAK